MAEDADSGPPFRRIRIYVRSAATSVLSERDYGCDCLIDRLGALLMRGPRFLGNRMVNEDEVRDTGPVAAAGCA